MGKRKQFEFYSQELLNNLFRHPYIKIEFIVRDLGITWKTAAKYPDELCKGGFLRKEKIGTSHFYVNGPLYALFTQSSQ